MALASTLTGDGIGFNGEKLGAFLRRSGTRKEDSILLFNTVLEVLATRVSPEEEIKGILIRKEEIKLSLFADVLIIDVEIPKN